MSDVSKKPGGRDMLKMVLAGTLAVGAASAIAQTNVPDPADPYVHEQTGMRFPARIGTFERHQVVRYNADGSDTGVGYQLIRDQHKTAYVSIFVYPAPPATTGRTPDQACAATFDGIKRDIISHEAEATIIEEGDVPAPVPNSTKRGLRATLSHGTASFDGQQQHVTEQATLFCYVGGPWLVAYRSTWPDREAPAQYIEELVKTIGWPQPLSH